MENNQQELAEKPKAKQYKSLGAMIKDGAFDVFIKDFQEMKKSGVNCCYIHCIVTVFIYHIVSLL